MRAAQDAEGPLFYHRPGAITSESWLVRTIQIHTTAMVGAAGAAGAAGSAAAADSELQSYTSAALVEDRSRRSYRLHSGGFSGGLETSRGGAGGGPGAGRHRGSSQPVSWTGGGAARARTRRAGVYAQLDLVSLLGHATRLLPLE